ncbi:MAG: tetratricopeptide repeat protein [Bryobacterales bacterium]|nr:tetratricopeptide repeat protein [Bryobacterales bacterium]
MVLLYGVDVFLARLEKKEVRLEAHQHFTEGTATLGKGETRAAIDALRQAYSLERGNRTYALALASAQILDGQVDAARFILDDVLHQDPNNSRGNLLMARLSVRRGNITLADSFYHRAIYGAWDAEPENRVWMRGWNWRNFLRSVDPRSSCWRRFLLCRTPLPARWTSPRRSPPSISRRNRPLAPSLRTAR